MATPINTWSSIEFTPPLEGSHREMAGMKHAGEAVKVWSLVRGLDVNFYGIGHDTTFKWLATEYTEDEGQYVVGFAARAGGLDPRDPPRSGHGALRRAAETTWPGRIRQL